MNRITWDLTYADYGLKIGSKRSSVYTGQTAQLAERVILLYLNCLGK